MKKLLVTAIASAMVMGCQMGEVSSFDEPNSASEPTTEVAPERELTEQEATDLVINEFKKLMIVKTELMDDVASPVGLMAQNRAVNPRANLDLPLPICSEGSVTGTLVTPDDLLQLENGKISYNSTFEDCKLGPVMAAGGMNAVVSWEGLKFAGFQDLFQYDSIAVKAAFEDFIITTESPESTNEQSGEMMAQVVEDDISLSWNLNAKSSLSSFLVINTETTEPLMFKKSDLSLKPASGAFSITGPLSLTINNTITADGIDMDLNGLTTINIPWSLLGL